MLLLYIYPKVLKYGSPRVISSPLLTLSLFTIANIWKHSKYLSTDEWIKCSISIQWNIQFSSVLSLSCVWLFETPWTEARQASLSITNSRSLLKLMSIEPVMPSSHLILCCPLLLLPSIFPSIRILSNELVLHSRWPNNWSFSFNISPSSENSGLIYFRMDYWISLQSKGLKNLLQHHSSKAPIVWCSAFFADQLSHPYITTGKTIALTRWTVVGKGMALLFNMLSSLFMTFFQEARIF